LKHENNGAGEGKWEALGQSAAGSPHSVATPGGAPSSLRSLGGVELRSSRIRYGAVSLENVNINIGAASAAATVPVQFSFEIHRGAPAVPISVEASMQALIDVADKRYGLHDVSMSGELKQIGGQGAVAWKFAAPSLDVDL